MAQRARRFTTRRTSHVLALCLLLVALVGLATPERSAARTTESARAPFEGIAGIWEGVFHVYPEVIHLRLDLRVDAGKVSGEAQFRTMEGQSANAFGTLQGHARVSGVHDPWSGAFTLTAVEWIQQPRRGMRLQLEGVHDTQSDALGGLLVNGPLDSSPYFALARSGAAGRTILEPARRAARARHVAAPTPPPLSTDTRAAAVGALIRIMGAARNAGKDVDLRAWAVPLRTEYPQLDLNKTQMGAVFLVARNLFADEYFERHFGKRYDAMNDAERTRHNLALSSELGKNKPLYNELGALGGGFAHVGTHAAPDIAVSVLGQRIVRAWRNGLLARVASVPPTRDALQQIASGERAADATLKLLWPSERKAVEEAIAAARARVAAPVLTASADDAVRSASGLAGANALAIWGMQNEQALGWVPAELRTDLLGRVEARMDELLDPLMAEEVAKLSRLGSGFAAVSAGNAWLREVVGRYGFALERPAVKSAVARLEERRAADLAAARPEISRQIAAQTRGDGVDSLLRTLLAVPGDRGTAPGTALLTLADQRKREIGWTERLAYFSPNERKYANATTGRLSIPRGLKLKPNADDIRMAVLRAFIEADGRWIDTNTVSHGFALFRGLLDYAVTVDGVEIGDGGYVCEAAAREATPYAQRCGEHLRISTGYEAHFTLHISLALTDEADRFYRSLGGVGGENAMVAIIDAMMKLEGPRKITHHLLLTPDGWRSPTMAMLLRLNNLSAFRDALMQRR